jgi:subtilisin family serine protease
MARPVRRRHRLARRAGRRGPQRITGTGLALDVAKHLGSDGLVLLCAPAEVDFASLNGVLAAAPGFQFAEPNLTDIRSPDGSDEGPVFPNDPLFAQKWSLHNTGQTVNGERGIPDADIDMPEAWNLITGGIGRSGHGLPDHSRGQSEVVVGVIDGGVDYTHPDLAANMWRNLPELNGRPGVDDDGNGFVDDVHGYDFVGEGDGDRMPDGSHGTHVAGIIGASGNNGLGVAGINWGVKIMALRIIAGGTGTSADAVEAINYATMMRKRGVNIRLTNNSWFDDAFSMAMRNAIAASGDAGMLFVASAGNNGRDTDLLPHYPSGYDLPNIISVAKTKHRDLKLPASNWGATSVDLGAPGRQILSTLLGGGYGFMSGTSMAAPHVSGVASLAWGLRPGATYERIRDAIFAGVDKIPAMQGATPTVTGGRLNAYNTLRLLTPRDALSDLAGELRGIVDSNPGSSLADKVEDALAKAEAALREFDKTPPDLPAVAGNIEGAIGDLEAAVKDGLLPAAQGVALMDDLAAVSRRIADEALALSLARGCDPSLIGEPQSLFAQADSLRAAGHFKDAAGKYKDALSKALSDADEEEDVL